MYNISRRDFLKIGGLSFVCMALGTSLYGCASENNESGEKETTEDGVWTKTGNKETKKAYEHMVYEIVPFKNNDDGTITDNVWYSYNNGEIIVPDGYAYVGSETLTARNGYGSSTYAVKYNYVNVVDVEVEEYVNHATEETSFPLAGTPLDLEVAQDTPKVLVK